MKDFYTFEEMEALEKADKTNMPDFLTDAEMEALEKSKLESVLRGAAQGASLGFADEISGALEAVKDIALTDKQLADFVDIYRKRRDDSRQRYKEAENNNPAFYTAGQIAGGIGTAVVPGLNVAKIGSVGGRIAATAGMGAVDAVGQNEDLGTLPADITKGAAIGGILGAAGEGLGVVANKITQKLNPENLNVVAEQKAVEALDPSLKQTRELNNKQKYQDVGREALDSGIVSLGSSKGKMLEKTQEKLSDTGETIGKIWEAVDEARVGTPEEIPLFQGLVDPKQVAENVRARLAKYRDKPAYRRELAKVERELQALENVEGTWGFKEAMAQKKAYGDVINNWGSDQPIQKKFLQTVYDEIDNEIMKQGENLIGSFGWKPDHGTEFKQVMEGAKKQYSDLKEIENILKGAAAREQKNNDFGLTDYIVGAGTFAGSGGEPVTAGLAAAGMAATRKIARQYGDQTLSIGADKLAKLLNTAGAAKLGKWGKILQEAAARGNNSLAATHFLLMQQNQDYREKVKEIESGEAENKIPIEIPKKKSIGEQIGETIDDITWTDTIGDRQENPYQALPAPIPTKKLLRMAHRYDKESGLQKIYSNLIDLKNKGIELNTTEEDLLKKLEKNFKKPMQTTTNWTDDESKKMGARQRNVPESPIQAGRLMSVEDKQKWEQQKQIQDMIAARKNLQDDVAKYRENIRQQLGTDKTIGEHFKNLIEKEKNGSLNSKEKSFLHLIRRNLFLIE